MLDLKAAAAEFMAERQKTFSHNRRESVGASEIGLCALRIWREKILGPEHYDKDYNPALGAAFRGDIIEDQFTVDVVKHAVAKQLPKGAELIWAGPGQQHSLVAKQWKLSATPDGMIINAPKDALAKYGVSDILGTSIVVEMKSFDPRIGDDKLPKQTHVDQVNVQLGLLRKEGKIIPAWGIIVYVNASFLDDVRVFPVMYDKLKFEGQIRRALFIMAQKTPVNLRPEGKVAGEAECRYCPFAKQCLGYIPQVPSVATDFERLRPGAQQALMSRAVAIDKVRQQIKSLEAKETALEADIKETMAHAGTKRAVGKTADGRAFRISWEKMMGRETLDMEKLEAFLEYEGMPLSSFKKRGAQTERILIKVARPTALAAENKDLIIADYAKVEDTSLASEAKEEVKA